MGLHEVIEETKKQLAEIGESEVEENLESEGEEDQEDLEDEEGSSELAEDDEGNEDLPEEKTEDAPEEKKLDDAGYARLRREAAANKKLAEENKRRAEELERENASLRERGTSDSGKEAERATSSEVPSELIDIIERERVLKAAREFTQLEENFKRSAPEDFEGVSSAYKAALYQSIRVQNPRMGHEELLEATHKSLLLKASNYLNAGYDPIEELYEEAKALGFKAQPQEEKREVERKPDLNKVAMNRKRNAGMAVSKGDAGLPQHTKKSATELTVAEWARLPVAEKQRLLYGKS